MDLLDTTPWRRRAWDRGRAATANAREDHLTAHLEPLTELAGPPHLRHQLRRNGFTGLIVRREGRQRRRIPDPFLEHLRRRLGEVALETRAAQAVPRAMTADQSMDDVAELVEERAHLVVRHQTRIVGASTRQARPRARPRECACWPRPGAPCAEGVGRLAGRGCRSRYTRPTRRPSSSISYTRTDGCQTSTVVTGRYVTAKTRPVTSRTP